MIPLLYLMLLVGCGLLAWCRGDPTERVAAAILVIGSLLSFVFGPAHLEWGKVSAALLAIDLAGLAAFLWLARRSEKYWPIWAASLQLLSLTAGIGQALKPSEGAIAYAIDEQIWAWLILLLVIGRCATLPRKTRSSHPSPVTLAGAQTP